jgi:hypothetical protein
MLRRQMRAHLLSRHRALARSSALFLVIIIAVTAIFAADSFLSLPGGSSTPVYTPACDPTLLEEMRLSATNLCLENVQVSASPTNSSELIVPVLVTSPGTTTSLEVLYLLSSETLGHTGPIQTITAAEGPVALSIPSGKVSDEVTFSNATLVFSNKSLEIYRYTLTAALGSDGYYAILPPFYWGVYPALAIGVDPARLNATALSTWGYSGVMQSAEFALPSSIVGTGALDVVNATVPTIPTCPSPVCVIISHSGF